MIKRIISLSLAALAVLALRTLSFADQSPAVPEAPEPESTAQPDDTPEPESTAQPANTVTPESAPDPAAADGGTGAASAETHKTAAVPFALAAPTVKIAVAPGGIKVTWNKVSGADRYMVYYREGGGGWNKIGTTDKDTYTRAASKLKSGVTYQFTVRCCKSDKRTLLSSYEASNSLPYLSPPETKIAVAPSGIKVTWNKVSGADRYMVYYREKGGSWKRIGTTDKNAYTRAASKLKGGVTYQFTVRCCKNDKKTLLSPYEASNALSYVAPPTVEVSNTANGIKVTWNKVSGAARYAVYYREGGGGWNKIGTTAGTTYTWKKAVGGKTYSFAVRCTDKNKSNISPYKAGSALTYIVPPTVKAVNIANGVKVTWNRVAGADTYRVYFRAKGSGSWNEFGDTEAADCVLSDLVLGMSYAFAVRGVDNETNALSGYESSGYLRYTGAAASPTDA